MVTQRNHNNNKNNNCDRKIPMENDPDELLSSLLQEIYCRKHPESSMDHVPTSDSFDLIKKFNCKTIDALNTTTTSRLNKVINQAKTVQELLGMIDMLTIQIQSVNHVLVKLLKKRDKNLQQQRSQYRYLEEFLHGIIQHNNCNSKLSFNSSSCDWTPKIIISALRYMIGERKQPELKKEMSLINKKLRQIGRRFSVNDSDNDRNSNNNSIPSNKTRRFSGQIRYKIESSSTNKNHQSSTSSTTINNLMQPNLDYNNDVGDGDADYALGYNNDDDDNDESGFEQWHNAMRMVARLPGGIPATFRKKLWLTLAECYIKQQRKISDWQETFEKCFNDSKNPDDEQLGWQIVKDLHRTGCSLFDDADQQNNQLLLKQLLLAYARFNKSIGYCQGFNMLAAIILEVMEGDVGHSLKIMIYLIENILPDGYFSNNLRGLSVDMVVFRDLMHLKLPKLAKHLDQLQQDSYDANLGIFYEPPLINAFTMQWFLTLFANCLPKPTVLRIWDLIFLEGNEILLRAAIVIWDSLSDRIIAVKSADEFYSIMNVLTREIMEFGPKDSNELIMAICNVATFPFPRLMELRDNYYYNCSPFNANIMQWKNNGLVQLFNNSLQKLFDDDQSQSRSSQIADTGDQTQQNWFEDQILMINWFLNQNSNNSNQQQSNQLNKSRSPNRSPIRSICSLSSGNSGGGSNFFETFLKQIQIGQSSQSSGKFGLAPDSAGSNIGVGSLDISMLKKQYLKLKQRQRQVQIILKEGFQNIDPGTINSKEQYVHRKEKIKETTGSPLISKLLSGKAPLMVKRKSRIESTIKQSISRAKFSGISKTVIKSNTMLEIGSKIDNGPNMDGKPTFDVVALQPSPVNILDQPERHRPEMSIKRMLKRSSSSSSGSGSTSTELCDEILGIPFEEDTNEDFQTAQAEDSEAPILRLPPPPPPPSSSGSLSRSLNDLDVLDNVVLVRKVRMQMDNDPTRIQMQKNIVDQNKEDDGICDDVFNSNNSTDGSEEDNAPTRASQLDETIRKFREKISQVKIE